MNATLFENEPYEVTAENFIKVCSCCYPGKSILALFPELSHCTISHGICPGHSAIYLKELREFKNK